MYKEILKTKQHNIHYLNRYINFIEKCGIKNKHLPLDEYTERHHICPKASDLFPEYENFKIHSWNLIELTARQHIIAHVMLWKVYGGSQAVALDCMLDKFNYLTNEKLFKRKIPNSILIRYLAKIRIEANIERGKHHIGMSTYKDSKGNKYYLHKNDPKINELNLVGNNSGNEHSEESKQLMSKTKEPNKRIKLYKLDKSTTVKRYSSEYEQLISDGWHTRRTEEDYVYIKEKKYKKVSEKMKGRSRYYYPDGVFYGMIYADDPIIKELNLSFFITDNHREQYKRRSELAIEANTGSMIYNNGIEEKKFKSDPGPEWIIGRLPRSEEYSKKFNESVLKANSNKIYWNNGVICKKFPSDINPGDEWVKGMLPRSKSRV